ncbi:LysE family translocator [Nitratireductor soli]|uniref:LysE family translocator n=1 Tax=Nitratireductor soli TaxID=1670619 RepID=UPI00065E6728|nr:LysE family transporter [Nitratireductor soli]
METDLHLPLILLAALIATCSPGPTTLTIAGTSMAHGRRFGLALAAGVLSGSLMWSLAAALGLGALMLASGWAFTAMRYFGACYLLYLAYKSARSALTPGQAKPRQIAVPTLRSAYAKGLALHLTNPKAILFFGALYSLGLPPGAPGSALAVVIVAIGLQSACVFFGYAVLFSMPPMVAGYARLRRWLEAAFAVAFGAASLKILTARLG